MLSLRLTTSTKSSTFTKVFLLKILELVSLINRVLCFGAMSPLPEEFHLNLEFNIVASWESDTKIQVLSFDTISELLKNCCLD